MAKLVAVLSKIPLLSYHLGQILPNLRFCDVTPGTNHTVSELQKVEIIVADFDLLIPYVDQLPSTKWVQGTWAGVDKLMPHLWNKQLAYSITRYSGKNFGLAMSEYVIASIVNCERDQRQQYENQRNALWSKEDKISQHRLVMDLSVGILGMGVIGKHMAQVLKLFGAKVWGMSRTLPREKLEYVDEYRTTENLSEILQNCDYIVNVLPSTNETRGLLNGDILKNCENRNTVFINVGRGNIIKETDLINALEQKWISAAILDVFEAEPLLKTSKLWTMPQVTISPHISGVTRPQDVAEVFAENYAKFLQGVEIPNTIDLKRGY